MAKKITRWATAVIIRGERPNHVSAHRLQCCPLSDGAEPYSGNYVSSRHGPPHAPQDCVTGIVSPLEGLETMIGHVVGSQRQVVLIAQPGRCIARLLEWPGSENHNVTKQHTTYTRDSLSYLSLCLVVRQKERSASWRVRWETQIRNRHWHGQSIVIGARLDLRFQELRGRDGINAIVKTY